MNGLKALIYKLRLQLRALSFLSPKVQGVEF